MKKIMVFLPAILFIMASLSAFSQKYETAADTVNLNKEYVNVSNDVADLTAKLTIARNDLPEYESRSNEAASNAKSTAITSSEKASNAVNGDIGDARKAKRNAKRTLKDAKEAQHVNNKEEEQNEKIAKLTSQLERKQQRLQELETMRTGINALTFPSQMKETASLSEASLSEIKENGKIYINHPNIDAVNQATKAYLNHDAVGNMKYFSDTAKVWMSGMDAPIPIKQGMAMWMSDHAKYDSITLTQQGYPDYLEYTKDNQKIVQSWWTWSGKSKNSGKTTKIPLVQFDIFSNDGKITFESIYGDFSKMEK